MPYIYAYKFFITARVYGSHTIDTRTVTQPRNTQCPYAAEPKTLAMFNIERFIQPRRCLTVSYRHIPLATETFKLSTPPAMGILTS